MTEIADTAIAAKVIIIFMFVHKNNFFLNTYLAI